MTNTVISVIGAGVLAVGGWAAASGLDGSEPARTVSIPAATTTGDDTTTQRTTTQETTTGAATTGAVTTGFTTTGDDTIDISGPCDEAEHANDPRCTGTTTTDDRGGDDDRSGPNRGPDGDDDNDDNEDEDRSGSNSGQG